MEDKQYVDQIERCDLVYRSVFTQEASAESVVPDTMPDIVRILDADAAVYLRSKSVDTGRVTLEGNIFGTVLYVGEETVQPLKLELSIPFSFTQEDAGLTDTDQLLANLRLNTAEPRIMNPRKILLRADVTGEVSVFRKTVLNISTESEDLSLFETLVEEKTVGCIASVEEKNFVVSEELSLPAAHPTLAQILLSNVKIAADETKKVGGKIMLQGNVALQLLYLPSDEDVPYQESFQIPFSQILDAPEGEAGISQAILYPSACYLEPIPGINGSSSVSLELHITAQVVCTTNQVMRYIADTYCLHHPCQVETGSVSVSDPFRSAPLRESLRETFELPESAAEILCSRAEASIPLVNDGSIKVPIAFHSIYRTESGQLQSVSKRLTAELDADPTGLTKAVIGTSVCEELYVSASGNSMEVRMAVELPMITGEGQTISYIRNAAAQTEEEIKLYEKPSLVAVRPDNRSYWTLAKQYYSTREMIEAVNPKGGEAQNILLIPRAR